MLYLPDELYGYRLNVSRQTARAALRHFIARTNDLAARPRFYNTFFSNCTNELAKTVNAGDEDVIPYHYSFVLTGFADRYLHRLGYLGETDSDFAAIRSAGHLNTIVRANAGAGEKTWPAEVTIVKKDPKLRLDLRLSPDRAEITVPLEDFALARLTEKLKEFISSYGMTLQISFPAEAQPGRQLLDAVDFAFSSEKSDV